jgi:hypothetical protein
MKHRIGSDQRGVAHWLLFVLIVVVIALIGVGVWKAGAKKDNSTKNSTTNSAEVSDKAKDQCMSQLNDSIYCKFAAAEAANPIDKSAFKATLTGSAGGVTSNIDFEQDKDGNTSMTMVAADTGKTQIINYKGVSYMKTSGQDTWIKYGSSTNVPTTTEDPTSDLSFMDSLLNIKLTSLGTEACGDATCYKYQFTDNLQKGATQYIWFDNQDYLLREYKVTGGDSGDLDMKISYPNVNISEPSPVQDLGSGLQ